MILSRLSNELRNQNWSTLVLELVVVVIGIYLGLQADAWNDARGERKLERFHLEQLREDAGQNAKHLTQRAERHAELGGELTFAIAAIKKGSLKPDELERFKWAILTMLQYPPAEISSGAYDTLIASGDFSVLSDSALRSQIVRLYSYLDTFSQRIPALTGGQQRDLIYSDEIVYAIPHPSGKGILWMVDYEQVRDHAGSLAFLGNERRNHSIVRDIYAEGARRASELQESITSLLSAN